MLSYDEMQYHPTSEQLVDVLVDKTQSDNPEFFRVLVAFYFAQVASMMRCAISTPDRGEIPVNLYAINLAPSGMGKGHSTTLIEEEITHQFRSYFLDQTFPIMADQNLPLIAHRRASRNGTDPDAELQKVKNEFDRLGPLVFSFDSATAPAVKQLRHKLLMAKSGSLNLQVDEIGNNLMAFSEIMSTFLELYDKGLTKQKLIKNSNDNLRSEEIRGATPTNMLLFGTWTRLLDGAKTEEEFFSMLDTGYARRCFFAFARKSSRRTDRTPTEIYDLMLDQNTDVFMQGLADKLEGLANIINVNKKLAMKKDTALLMIEYKLKCEAAAEKLREDRDLEKAELSHRYFKALKLAGAYAFIDDSPELTETHLYNAIKVAEDSGNAFQQLLLRDRNYVKLAKYLGNMAVDVTQADLVEDLPFYRGSQSVKAEMMQLAIAYGYKNNIIIKKSFTDGIEFLRGESLKPTDLSAMTMAYSQDMTQGYNNDTAPFDQLHKMTQAPGIHWVSHHLKGGYRNEDNAVPGFNLLVIDVDGTCNLSTAQLLLKGQKALYYTTKRHTDQHHRFRIILPLTHELRMEAKDFKEFYNNVLEWLPFEADPAANHRSKKWLSHPGHFEYTDGEMFDPLPFIPKTSKNEVRKEVLQTQQQMDNLERWVVNNTGDGNRNQMLHRYAMILVDAGFDFDRIRTQVMALNDKLPDKLEETELLSTVMVTIGKALSKR